MDKWYVVKTKPKKEVEVSNRLRNVTFEVFLPQIKALSPIAYRLSPIASSKPLFPSYLFIRTNFDNPCIHRMVRFTRGISKILGDASGPSPIADFIIETLRERTRDGSLIEQELLFKEGDEVTVKKGILKDLQGIVEKNLSDSGRVKVLFKWLNGNMRAVLRYIELERAA